jgi:hypothetical protein
VPLLEQNGELQPSKDKAHREVVLHLSLHNHWYAESPIPILHIQTEQG